MTWVLIVVGAIGAGDPVIGLWQFQSLEECHVSGERLQTAFNRNLHGTLSFSCKPSDGSRQPSCGLSVQEPCDQ